MQWCIGHRITAAMASGTMDHLVVHDDEFTARNNEDRDAIGEPTLADLDYHTSEGLQAAHEQREVLPYLMFEL